MFPIHCAVLGGSIELVKWLAETHLCPLSVAHDTKTGRKLSVQTSASRTLLDLAMQGRPKTEILGFLFSKGLSATDVKDAALVPKTLEAILKAGGASGIIQPVQTIPDDPPDETSISCVEDACCLCYERPMDCVLTPCGHQMCCAECGDQLETCPVCKARCTVLKVFRQ